MWTRNNKGTYSQKHIDLNHKSSLEQGSRMVKAWAINNPCGRGAHARLLLQSSFIPCRQASFVPQVFLLWWNFTAVMSPAYLRSSGEKPPLLLLPLNKKQRIGLCTVQFTFHFRYDKDRSPNNGNFPFASKIRPAEIFPGSHPDPAIATSSQWIWKSTRKIKSP